MGPKLRLRTKSYIRTSSDRTGPTNRVYFQSNLASSAAGEGDGDGGETGGSRC